MLRKVGRDLGDDANDSDTGVNVSRAAIEGTKLRRSYELAE